MYTQAGKDASDARVQSLSKEYYVIMTRAAAQQPSLGSADLLEKEQELCQTLRDLMGVNEVIEGGNDLDTKYKALRADLKALPPSHEDYKKIVAMAVSFPRIVSFFHMMCFCVY